MKPFLFSAFIWHSAAVSNSLYKNIVIQEENERIDHSFIIPPPIFTPYHPPILAPYHPPILAPYHPPILTPYQSLYEELA